MSKVLVIMGSKSDFDVAAKAFTVLKKFGVKKTQLFITKFVVEGGKLKTIEFKMVLDDGTEYDVDCVACMTVPEIDDLID